MPKFPKKFLPKKYNCFCGKILYEATTSYYRCLVCKSNYHIFNNKIVYSTICASKLFYFRCDFISTTISVNNIELMKIDGQLDIEECKSIVNKYLDNLIFL